MKITDIKRGKTYQTPQGWNYWVNDITDSGAGDSFVQYTVTRGDKEGTQGSAPIQDFASRVVCCVKNNIVTLRGGI